MELNTQAQQREAVAQWRSLSPYRLRYNNVKRLFKGEAYRITDCGISVVIRIDHLIFNLN
ncbi:MAG: hypothetical protein LBJ00_15505 [Planctomycetaceae bacterium]|jgi:hypothetical protein|nr:hypothetical protein [Planctomycetaceae bacterium]